MKDSLAQAVKELKKYKEIQGIYLFGSVAKGRNKPLSDIDLALVTTPLSTTRKAEITLALPEKYDISLFLDLPISIRYKILKEGKIIYNKNNLFLKRAQISTFNQYLDFRPILERRIKKVLRS